MGCTSTNSKHIIDSNNCSNATCTDKVPGWDDEIIEPVPDILCRKTLENEWLTGLKVL